jgi:hypothetical protein
MKIIIASFPKTLVTISKCYNEEINSDNEDMKYMLIAPRTRKNLNTITVKELQVTLKKLTSLMSKARWVLTTLMKKTLQDSGATARTQN